MMDELAGGASRSTNPAAGTSSATDVSLREHFEALRAADGKLAEALRSGDQEALRTALTAAKELASAHNGLLRKMELRDEAFVTKDTVDTRFKRLEAWQARIAGGIVAVGAIGIANLVKIWT
jgi:hypothetical protein